MGPVGESTLSTQVTPVGGHCSGRCGGCYSGHCSGCCSGPVPTSSWATATSVSLRNPGLYPSGTSGTAGRVGESEGWRGQEDTWTGEWSPQGLRVLDNRAHLQPRTGRTAASLGSITGRAQQCLRDPPREGRCEDGRQRLAGQRGWSGGHALWEREPGSAYTAGSEPLALWGRQGHCWRPQRLQGGTGRGRRRPGGGTARGGCSQDPRTGWAVPPSGRSPL